MSKITHPLRNPLLVLLILAAAWSPPHCVADDATEAAAVEARLASVVGYLASDDLEGRGVGTAGIDRAAEYIAQTFAEARLKTDLFDGGPFQKFVITTQAKLGENNKLAIVAPAKDGQEPERTDLKPTDDFTPLAMSGSGKLDLPLVFAGYGITAKDLGYDDYDGIDVQGKAVIIIRHEPQQANPHSPFDGTEDSQHAPLRRKVANAFEHGAAAVIFCTDEHEIRTKVAETRKKWQESLDRLAEEHARFKQVENPSHDQIEAQRKRIGDLIRQIDEWADRLRSSYDPVLPFGQAGEGEPRDFPVVHIRRELVDSIIRAAMGKDLAAIESEIDSGPAPRSSPLEGWRVTGEVHVERQRTEVKNVVAVLPGDGPLASEAIVIGAHYDHLGWGGPGSGSLVPKEKAIHNGADDNASGVAVLLESARTLAAQETHPRRTVVFVAFTAEESGLLGSSHYVGQPVVPIENTVAMLNLDMVGRLRDEKLIVGGSGTASGFENLLDQLSERHALAQTKNPSGFGPSDHAAFYGRKVPVLHFFTGTHDQYHRPSDDPDTLNVPGMRRIAALVADAAMQLATAPERPEYVAVARPAARTGGDRPYFGSIPDFAQQGPGYAISGVAEDSPAQRAGLQPGDVIVQLADSRIGNLEDFDSALRKQRGGDRIHVVVKRGGVEETLEVTLDPPR